MPLGLPLRTRKTIVDVYGVALFGRRVSQPGLMAVGLVDDGVDVGSHAKRDDVGLQAIDYRARLFAGAAVRLLDVHGLAGLLLPIVGKGFIELLIQLARGVVGDVQQMYGRRPAGGFGFGGAASQEGERREGESRSER